MEDYYLQPQPPLGYQTACFWDPETQTMRRELQKYSGSGRVITSYDPRTVEPVDDEPMPDYDAGDGSVNFD